MEFTRTERQETLRREFFAAGRDLLRTGAAARDAGAPFERSLWRAVAGTGLFALHLPKWAGGRDASVPEAAAAFEGFAAGCEDAGFLISILAHVGLVQSALMQFGTESQQRTWLPGLANGSLIGCFAITEPECGSDVRAVRLTAQPSPAGGWELSGVKWNITNAPVADVCITLARLVGPRRHGLTAFLTDLRRPGVTRSAPFELMGNRTTPVGAMTFAAYHAPAEALLGRLGRGLRVVDFAFVVERILTGIGIAGILEPLLQTTLARTQERRAFGRPIGDHQYVQEHLVRMYAGRELVRSAAWRALGALLCGEECSALASVVKMTATQVFHESALGALRVHGNQGYHRGQLVERLCRDAAGVFFAGGTEEIHKNIIWRQLCRRRAPERSQAELGT